MKSTWLSKFLTLSLALVYSGPSQASMLRWLDPLYLADKTFERVENCVDILFGFGPEHHERARINRAQDAEAMLVAAVAAAVIRNQQRDEARQAKFRETREFFLATFAEGSAREMATEKLKVLKAENSDADDLAAFENLLNISFAQISTEQFRLLGSYIIARTDYFKSATDVNRAIALITSTASHLRLSSNEIALLQISMISSLKDFSEASSSLDGLKLILGDWSLNIEASDLFAVGQAVDAEVKTYKSNQSRAAAEAIFRDYAERYKAFRTRKAIPR